jgi:Zn-dependent M16 (insulinase) family peptidase
MVSVPYGSNDTSGQITISFIGPGLQDSLTISALGVLGDYLASSPHSVLNHDLVEVTEPACAGEYIFIDWQKLSLS